MEESKKEFKKIDNIKHDELAWNIIDKFFEEGNKTLIKHHLESYNKFF